MSTAHESTENQDTASSLAAQSDPTRVVIAGDWHGSEEWAESMLHVVAERGHTHVLHVGDFGVWGDEIQRQPASLNGVAMHVDSFTSMVAATAESLGITVFVTLGNHENYTFLGQHLVPSQQHPGWMELAEQALPLGTPRGRVVFAPRGFRWHWSGREFLSIGGANSIDRWYRRAGRDWWKQEQISDEDVAAASSGGHADVVISHDAPRGVNLFATQHSSGWGLRELAYAGLSRDQLRRVSDVVQPKLWFHGHHHREELHETQLVSEASGEGYVLNSRGLDMNGSEGNLIELEVSTLRERFIRYV